MGLTAELAADIWDRAQQILDLQVTPEDMANPLDQESTPLRHSLGRMPGRIVLNRHNECASEEEATANTKAMASH